MKMKTMQDLKDQIAYMEEQGFDPKTTAVVLWDVEQRDQVKEMGDKCIGLHERINELLDALIRFGRHEGGPDGCRFDYTGDCSCGLQAAIKPKR